MMFNQKMAAQDAMRKTKIFYAQTIKHLGQLNFEEKEEVGMRKEIGTLKEIGAKPKDVVEFVAGWNDMYPKYIGKTAEMDLNKRVNFNPNPYCGFDELCYHTFRMVKRVGSALPYGHVVLSSGAIVDLTSNTTAFGLMDAEVQDAMRKHGGSYEMYLGRDGWNNNTSPIWAATVTYRVKPKPIITAEKTTLAGQTVAVDKVDGVPDWSTLRLLKG